MPRKSREQAGAPEDVPRLGSLRRSARLCHGTGTHRHGAASLRIAGAGAQPRVKSVGIGSSRRERLASAGPILQDLRLTRRLEKNNPS